jgi:hypothetical protein
MAAIPKRAIQLRPKTPPIPSRRRHASRRHSFTYFASKTASGASEKPQADLRLKDAPFDIEQGLTRLAFRSVQERVHFPVGRRSFVS